MDEHITDPQTSKNVNQNVNIWSAVHSPQADNDSKEERELVLKKGDHKMSTVTGIHESIFCLWLWNCDRMIADTVSADNTPTNTDASVTDAKKKNGTLANDGKTLTEIDRGNLLWRKMLDFLPQTFVIGVSKNPTYWTNGRQEAKRVEFNQLRRSDSIVEETCLG